MAGRNGDVGRGSALTWYSLDVPIHCNIHLTLRALSDSLPIKLPPMRVQAVRTSGSADNESTRIIVIHMGQCYGPPPDDPDDGFKLEVSASLKGDRSLSMIMDMQRPTLLASAALHVMHPKLYWASVRTHVKLGHWLAEQGLHDMHHLLKHWASIYTGATVMCNHKSPDHRDLKFTNLGIELVYNPGVMVSYSGHLVRYGIRVDEGDQMVWAWFLQDSVHNYARTPHPDYATYNLVNLHAYQLTKYNQADFVVYGNP
ncbi:uncharacterized protein EDB91DRAFT_1254366 [Suillus paluster]|uniref:uncharacterized protein n=1 Tax=Suillus paluster TaxID=48578 RepID=UPI001B880070|nr:uncharacterized protein EDB91DRAFT_1254366 [Suillus paluster]KAG1726347.1 hypothetical protein EDB91DRAFT_1254366 [Suillus paluster]